MCFAVVGYYFNSSVACILFESKSLVNVRTYLDPLSHTSCKHAIRGRQTHFFCCGSQTDFGKPQPGGVGGVPPAGGPGAGAPGENFRISGLKYVHFTRVSACARLAFVLRVQQHMPGQLLCGRQPQILAIPLRPAQAGPGAAAPKKFCRLRFKLRHFQGVLGAFRVNQEQVNHVLGRFWGAILVSGAISVV